MKKRVVALLLLAAMLLSACGGTPASTTSTAATKSATASTAASTAASKPATATTSKDYSTVYATEITTLNYLWSTTNTEQAPGANCVSGLLENDKYGNMKYDLAVSHTKSDDGLVWTFKIREGVKWYDFEGKEYDETTAEDFVAAAKWVMNPDNGSKTGNLYYDVIKNGREYFKKEITDFSQVGVKALDKYTIQYTLSRPVPYFLSMITYTVFYPASAKLLKQVGDAGFAKDHKSFVNNGAYILKKFEPQVERLYEANPNYYDKDKVLVKKLTYKYNKEASTLAPELFLQGEISAATIPITMIDSWLKDPAKKDMVRPSWGKLYNYFFLLNFWPNPDKMDAKHQPANWEVAVNNLNFRKAIFHGLNRLEMAAIYEPFEPAKIMSRTLTPVLFASAPNGTEYTQLGDMKAIADTEPYDVKKAAEFKAKAMEELKGKATFPVICYYPYSSATQEAANMAQTLEQTLEKNLGKDFIDVVIEALPATGFTQNVRMSGNFCIYVSNWGADYIDPESYTDPLRPEAGVSFNHSDKMIDPAGKQYLALINEAQKEFKDLQKRYELFAKAEAFCIDQCIAMPWRFTRSYVASTLVPFSGQWANAGSGNEKFKGIVFSDKTCSWKEFDDLKATWEKEQKESIKDPKILR